jgi:hypothetical protein
VILEKFSRKNKENLVEFALSKIQVSICQKLVKISQKKER